MRFHSLAGRAMTRSWSRTQANGGRQPLGLHWFWCSAAVLAILLSAARPAAAQRADDKIAEAAGFVIEVRGTEADVLRAVQSVVEETVIYGTHVYDKEDTLTGAEPAKNSELFAPWHEPGQVFFKDSNDVGPTPIRYVVQPVNELHTRLRIDAVFVEDMRRKAHASDGTVETS